MNRLFFKVIATSVPLVAAAREARAESRETIRVTYEAPAECASQTELTEKVTALGGAFYENDADDLARTFAVRIVKRAHYEGELVVRDVAGDRVTRRATAARCEEVIGALALFFSIAIDVPPPRPIVSRAEPPAARIAADDGDDDDRPEMPPARMGIALAPIGAVGHAHDSAGGRIAVVHRIDAFHLGGAFDLRRELGGESGSLDTASGDVLRAAAHLSYGAPWDDHGFGVALEAGLAIGHFGGIDGRGERVDRGFVAPYASGFLLFQARTRTPLRPFWGFFGAIDQNYDHKADLSIGATTGLAWRTW